MAVAAANAYYAALIQYVTVNVRRQFAVEIAAARKSLPLTSDPAQRRIVSDRLSSLTALSDATTGPVRVVQPSQAGVASPHPVRNALLALLLAVLIAPALLIALEPLDRKLRKPRDLERLAGTALLAGVPHAAFAAARPDLAADHAFERLRDSLIYLDPDRRPRTFAIISPLPGEGRTTVATGLAASFARGGRRVVLVDGDLTTPRVAGRTGVPPAPGLTDVHRRPRPGFGPSSRRGLRRRADRAAGRVSVSLGLGATRITADVAAARAARGAVRLRRRRHRAAAADERPAGRSSARSRESSRWRG